MNRLLAALVATVVLAACAPAQAEAGGDAGFLHRHGSVDLHDTFAGPLDADAWTTCYWWVADGCTNLGNHEAQWYTPAQVSTSGGVLRLTATPQRSTHLGRHFTHASGMVSTGRSGDGIDDVARYAFTYGQVEVRFRTPAGRGLWPAIWMLPVTNRSLPEIDLMEQYGGDPDKASMTLHASGAGSHAPVERTVVRTPDLSKGWHTIGLEWTPGHLRWTLDGKATFEVSGSQVPDEPMYLLANLAVGGRSGQRPAGSGPASFLIDELTVWTLS